MICVQKGKSCQNIDVLSSKNTKSHLESISAYLINWDAHKENRKNVRLMSNNPVKALIIPNMKAATWKMISGMQLISTSPLEPSYAYWMSSDDRGWTHPRFCCKTFSCQVSKRFENYCVNILVTSSPDLISISLLLSVFSQMFSAFPTVTSQIPVIAKGTMQISIENITNSLLC